MLENGSQLTQKDLIRETSLPSRTVRYALNRLKEEQILIERHYFIDARQSLYGLNPPQMEVVAV
ncbi:MAG: winged helix-turn-helix transcriptional regulator [Methanoregula sp.]|uniref:winged helix-turn-helix transcriptional regulator n=1 Tax=Methanoregula sp. TaxID=2052170 RepID=UPI003C157128